jgi:uncharacterized alkaline shock family protein YloU
MSADHVVERPDGTVTVTGAAIAGLVARAAEGVAGAHMRRPKRGPEVELASGRARVTLDLAADRGAVLPELGRAVQESVAAALSRSCGIAADSVDVTFNELRS